MLKRNIYEKLVTWKNNKNHHPLILSGLRQTGKTTSVKDFGEKNYKNIVYMDLRASKSLHEIFEGDFDVDKMVSRITAYDFNAKFTPQNTLIIMDEIQDCPNARSSLKYWDLDKRYDVIATGSFLGVKGFRKQYSRGIPVGYEEHLTMFPLSFREFLDNYGMPSDILNYVQDCINNLTIIDKAIHERMRELYLEYLIVGGMPEAVNIFFKNRDINAVRAVQNKIITSIKADLGRFLDTEGNEKINEVLKLRAEACLNSLPSQLTKEYKKFMYSGVNNKARSEDKADALEYLSNLGLVIKAHNLREISSPLEAQKIEKEYKAFYADTGLLISELDNDAAKNILKGNLSAYKGAILENMVAASFYICNKNVYYYRDKTGSPELDFVVNLNDKETIVECKVTNGKVTSMKFVLEHPKKYGKHPAIKIADTNIGISDNFITYPIYFCGFLKEKNESLVIPKYNFDDLILP